MKNIAKSLVTDVLKDKVERHAKGDDRLDLEPAQMAEYLEGARVVRARQLLEESAGKQLSRAESTDIRNSLALQILLANAKRAGDVTHIRKVAIMEAESKKGEDAEVEVSTALNKIDKYAHAFWLIWFVGVLTPLSTIFKLYRGDQF